MDGGRPQILKMVFILEAGLDSAYLLCLDNR